MLCFCIVFEYSYVIIQCFHWVNWIFFPIDAHITDSNRAESDIKQELHKKTFGSLRFGDKLLIVQNGRPCPSPKNLSSKVKERGREYTRHFTVSNYDSHTWLCGSESLSKLFSWACLLFSKSKNVWSFGGFSNLNGLTKSTKTHKNSESHLQCVLDLYNFGKQQIDEGIDKTLKVNNILHNQKVKKNDF